MFDMVHESRIVIWRFLQIASRPNIPQPFATSHVSNICKRHLVTRMLVHKIVFIVRSENSIRNGQEKFSRQCEKKQGKWNGIDSDQIGSPAIGRKVTLANPPPNLLAQSNLSEGRLNSQRSCGDGFDSLVAGDAGLMSASASSN